MEAEAAKALGPTATGQVQSLTRALGLLEILADREGGLSLSELSLAASLPRSTTHRLMTTMEAMRFVRFERERNRWVIGVQTFTIGQAFARSRDIGELAKPIAQTLMKELGETINVAILEDGHMRYVAQAAHVHGAETFASPGQTAPFHASAAGKSVLAYGPAKTAELYLKASGPLQYTRRTMVALKDLMSDLQVTRARGYAIDDAERRADVRCVAAPVFDERGQPLGAFSVSTTCERLPESRQAAVGARLRDAARILTVNIGGRWLQ
ncbi:MAG: IclR family transcriptional regulator [Parvularculaceae bacterium]